MRPALYSLLILLCSCTREEKPVKIEMAVPVQVETVKRQTVPINLEVIGVVDSPVIVAIRPQVGGIVETAHVEPGQIVKKGDLLFSIDSRSYRAHYDKVQANLIKDTAAYEFAKKRVERFTDMVKKEFISKLSFDEYQREMEIAKAQVLNDEAELALAKIDLEHCRISAPIDGRISNIRVDPGNLVVPNHEVALTELRQISPICVAFHVPQKDLQHMHRTKCGGNLKMEVILPHENGDDNDSYIGHLNFIDNHIDPQTGTILLKGMVDNEEHLLWPGEFVRIRMCLREKENVLLAPESSILNGRGGPFIYVIQDEVATVKPVVLGEKVGSRYIVEKGIEAGDQVVTSGQLRLSPGKKVTIR